MFPVDPYLPEVLAAIRACGAVVVEAPPGTGKTTRVPIGLADHIAGQILVLEPRRVAARAAAGFVARSLGEAVGGRVGYAMRLERRAGPETRVLYVTEALLTRRLATDPGLAGVGCVVIDEFHERSIHADVALAWVRALREARPDLALVVMSATMDGERVAGWLGCARLRVEVERFPVEIAHVPLVDGRPLWVRAAAGARRMLASQAGDVLVFLPGVGEIRRCREELEREGGDRPGPEVEILELHGELSGEDQDRALRRSAPGRRRVVLATNIAETSVTLDGVRAVVDSGLARVAGHDPWSGVGTLELQPIPRASAAQRAGRAGRQGPGACLRLYTQADHDSRPAEQEPEIRRMDLSGTLLELGGRELRWLDPPPPGAWQAARQSLARLGLIGGGSGGGSDGRTPLGDRAVRLPLPPRLARMLLEAERLGVEEEAAAVAAALAGGERRREGVWDPVRAGDLSGGRGQQRAEQRQLLDALRRSAEDQGRAGRGREGPDRRGSPEERLRRALFAGFPDRVGRRRGSAGACALAAGGSAQLEGAGAAKVAEGACVLVLEVERIAGVVKARALTEIPMDWLLDEAEVRTTVRWAGTRVEVREQWVYGGSGAGAGGAGGAGGIVLEEGPGQGSAEEIAACLYENVRHIAHRVFPDHEAAVALLRRAAWLRRIGQPLPELELEAILRVGCAGCRSAEDLSGVSLCALIREQIGGYPIDRMAPERMQLGGRRASPIDYPEEGDPFISSRLQDFFGLPASPTVADGRPLLLHLLAPNQRPVQITGDLRGFWERHYPSIRKELQRKYPRHAWPEDPTDPEDVAASQPAPRRR